MSGDLAARLAAVALAAVAFFLAAVGWVVVRPALFDLIPPVPTLTAPPSAKGAAITTAGVLVVGRDVAPGDYQTFAPPGCTWAVLNSVEPGADGGEVIDSGAGPGPVAVHLSSSAAALLSVGCGPWQEMR